METALSFETIFPYNIKNDKGFRKNERRTCSVAGTWQVHKKGMKKKGKSLLFMLLVCVLVLAACSKGKEPEGGQSTKNPEEKTEQDSSKGEASGSDESQEQGNGENSLPLTEEPATIRAFVLYANQFVENPNDLPVIQELEKRTNVHVEWSMAGYADMMEKFGLLIASGDLPDLIYSGGMAEYQNGGQQGVEDGIYLDCTDLIKANMPHYQSLRTSTPDLERDTMTDEGRLICVYTLPSDDEGPKRELDWMGLALRKDLLDSWGFALPETVEDWYHFLKKAKEEGYSAPLLLEKDGTINGGAFLTAYGVLKEFYLEDGVVKYGPAEEGYQQYVSLMRQWFAEGLIDPDFMAGSDAVSMYLNDKTVASGFGWMYAANGFYTNGLTKNEAMYIQAVANPVSNRGEIPYGTPTAAPAAGNPIYFSAKSKNLELAARWLDYLYTDEGMCLMHYGAEGETYTREPELQYTDRILHYEEFSPTDALGQYAAPNLIGRYDWEYLDHLNGENGLVFQEQKQVWVSNDPSMVIPEMATLSMEDAYTYNNQYTGIQTLVNETTIKAITGSISMEEFETAMKGLSDYGLYSCIDAWQAAVERYQNRGSE